MIARKNRFHGYGSLRYVYQHGQVVRGPICSIKFVTNPKRHDYRLAVVVSKKVSRSAVTRNRMRRRLYEAVRQEAARLSPHDMVITVFSDQLVSLPDAAVRKMVSSQLRQGGLLQTTGVPEGHDVISYDREE